MVRVKVAMQKRIDIFDDFFFVSKPCTLDPKSCFTPALPV